MKHSTATEQLFDQVIADTPPEMKREVEWSNQIADKIYAALRRKGLSQTLNQITLIYGQSLYTSVG